MKLLIFTQKVDKNDPVLGFFHGWINEFSKYGEIQVVCLEKGEYELPENVKVYSLGKERGAGRFKILLNLLRVNYQISGSYNSVFIHMNPIYVVILGWFWRLKRIPIYLWYVHRSVDFKLYFSIPFVNKIFTSAPESFKIKTSKAIYLGHGVDPENFPHSSHLYTGNELHIAHIGRITRIKHIEVLIKALSLLREKNLNVTLTLFGDYITDDDKRYKQEMIDLISSKELDKFVTFAGWKNQKDLAHSLEPINIAVNLAPTGGMDKSVLESILLGLPVFTANKAFEPMYGEYSSIFLYDYLDEVSLVDRLCAYIYTAHNQYILDTLRDKITEEYGLKKLVKKMTEFIQ